jgi:carboxypeptidase C (cathepsin A)
MPRTGFRLAAAALLAALLAACGGGGGGDAAPASAAAPAASGALRDTTAYSSAAGASLAASTETASITAHTIAVAGTSLPYTATAGHLDARDPRSGATEASLFYVAYTVAGAAATRPLVFFYNGGPGSATIWLHLGGYAPRRVVTNAPAATVPQPFQLVDNGESLIDVADLVFVDAVGTGYSEAVAPATNQSFWGVDRDAALMRDFIARYVAVNQRQASPTFIFGESYGTTRSAVLAELMLAAGMRLDGVVLQSSILDYNVNCDVFAPGALSCEGFLPSYGEVGAWYRLAQPVPADADAYAATLRPFAAAVYGPAAAAFAATRQPAPPGLVDQLVALTGAPAPLWNANLDLDPLAFRSGLVPGQQLGRYDARIGAAVGSALAASGDPSSALINAPFAAAAQQLFNQELLYAASAAYTTLSSAIASWDFHHDGRPLPDTIPDLAAALVRHPGLRVLSLAGYHDLATPFFQTELDLARLGAQPGVFSRVYAGGHMTYLDDASRARLKADIAAFVRGAPMAAHVDAAAPHVDASVAAHADATRAARVEATMQSAATVGANTARSSSLPTVLQPGAAPAQAELLDRPALAQGGDPYLPPALRILPSAPSPHGAALAAQVRAKIAARDRDPYR